MELEPKDYINVIAPPPVVLVSTLYGDVKNIAPYGMNMPVSHHPPLVALGIVERRDTFQNIKDTEEFVVAYPSPELVDKIDITAESFPRDVSEFEQAGLTAVKSKIVKPFRVKECPVNLECKLEWYRETGDHYLVVGQVVAASIADELHREDLSRAILDPVYHAGSKEAEYARKGSLIK